MIILGISTFVQNPAACLLVDGKLIAFAEEERFIRIKSANGKFPSRAILYCLQEAGLEINEIEKVAIGWDATKYFVKMPLLAASLWLKNFGQGSGAYDSALHELVLWRPENIKARLSYEFISIGYRGKIPPLEFVPHHLAHAASSYYASGFSNATILVLDGSGEERATTVYQGSGKTIKEFFHYDIPNSLGWFYAATTAYLGFKPYEDDGFVMGLAPYGKPTSEMRKKVNTIVQLNKDGAYSVDPKYTLLGRHTTNEHFSDQYIGLFGKSRVPGHPMTTRHKNIAFAVQEKLEEVILTIAERSIEKTGHHNVCLAGGVALNCKANGVVAQSPRVEQLFVQPASHDAGTALGAAMIIAMDSGDDPRFCMEHARWGPSFDEKTIKNTLDQAGITYSKPRNITKEIVELIAEGKIVARFAGRMEVGPRALGSRSILADATKIGMNDSINDRVKHRDPWRPFCPSMTREASSDYLIKPKEDRFMTVTYKVPKQKQSDIPSVVHVDGTTRPQVVDKHVNPAYFEIINKVGDTTGSPVILNTSFNVKGEPMVCSPGDALRCYFSTGIHAMAIENFWLKKQ